MTSQLRRRTSLDGEGVAWAVGAFVASLLIGLLVEPFRGAIDEFAVYARVLPDEEIAAHYAEHYPGIVDVLVIDDADAAPARIRLASCPTR